MKKIVLVIIGIVILVVGVFILLQVRKSSTEAKGVLKVTSTPATTLFLNNQSLGKTPYEDKVKPGEYTLKLVPETTVGQIVPWEGKIVIRPNLLTFINRELKDSEFTSSGEMLSLEQSSGNVAALTVISTPDAATVTVDSVEKGKTPINITDLKPGDYEVSVAAVGYAPRSLKVKTTAGYKLTAVFNLAATSLPSPAPIASPTDDNASPKPSSSSKTSPSPASKASPKASGSTSSHSTPPAKPYVQILETPTGFLRVRSEPGSAAEEVGRVNPDEYYALLDEKEVSSTPWYQIEYADGKDGWVSSQYAKKSE